MAQHESSGFKNAADKAAYESDYADRERDHKAEERRYINSDRDANLFQNVRHKVLIAGFKHGQQCPGKDKWKGRNITTAALAGYCGHLYTTELMEWLSEKRVVMVFQAFKAIEKARFDATVIDIPHLSAKNVWAQLNNPQNVDLVKKDGVEINVDGLRRITDQNDMEILISELPDLCGRAQKDVDDAKGMTKTQKNARKKEISYVAMGIQLERFQQVLLHTSNGHRFFPGKADLEGNPGCRVFEGSIEIEDLSRAVELFASAKIRTQYKRNAEGERLNKARDVLAEKPCFYSPSVIADRNAAKAATGRDDRSAAPVMRDQRIEATGSEIQHALSESLSVVPESDSGTAVNNSDRGRPTCSDIKQERQRVTRSNESSGKPEVAYEDLRILWKDQARIEEGKAKAKQKQSDIKKKVSDIKQTRRNDENKLKRLEEKLERLRQTLKDLEGLAEQYQEATTELKNLDRAARVLVSDFDLAAIKRKRDELEQDEARIKKQKQALVDED